MKKQYRIIPDCGTYGFELYHNGELIETKTFCSSEYKEYIEKIGDLGSSGYIQGYLPEEVQIVKNAYEERLAKVITSESDKPEQKEEIAEEYIKKEDVLKILYDIKENKNVPKNYGTLIDIIQQARNLPSSDVTEVKHGKWKNDGEDWFCTRCNHNALCDKMTGEEILSVLCPHCGAKMD